MKRTEVEVKNFLKFRLYLLLCIWKTKKQSTYIYDHFKSLLKENNLSNIRRHNLKVTYDALLLSNSYSPKAVSKLSGHSKELITVDVYGDNHRLVEDCLA